MAKSGHRLPYLSCGAAAICFPIGFIYLIFEPSDSLLINRLQTHAELFFWGDYPSQPMSVVLIFFVISKILRTFNSAREQRYFAFGTWVAMADSLRRRGLR